jgi:hypothetical protein
MLEAAAPAHIGLGALQVNSGVLATHAAHAEIFGLRFVTNGARAFFAEEQGNLAQKADGADLGSW